MDSVTFIRQILALAMIQICSMIVVTMMTCKDNCDAVISIYGEEIDYFIINIYTKVPGNKQPFKNTLY